MANLGLPCRESPSSSGPLPPVAGLEPQLVLPPACFRLVSGQKEGPVFLISGRMCWNFPMPALWWLTSTDGPLMGGSEMDWDQRGCWHRGVRYQNVRLPQTLKLFIQSRFLRSTYTVNILCFCVYYSSLPVVVVVLSHPAALFLLPGCHERKKKTIEGIE